MEGDGGRSFMFRSSGGPVEVLVARVFGQFGPPYVDTLVPMFASLLVLLPEREGKDTHVLINPRNASHSMDYQMVCLP
jgi:hypothetical protein